MSWRVVAERDARDPFRSMSALTLFGAYAILFALAGYLQSGGSSGVAGGLPTLVQFIVPLTALGVSYGAIAGARDDGSLRVMLSYPHSRFDVALGTALGRAIVTCAAITTGYVVSLVVFVAAGGSGVSVTTFVGGWLLSCLLGVAFVGIGVGASATARTARRAVGLAASAFLLFLIAWNAIPTLVRYVAAGFQFSLGPTPTWARVFNACSPLEAYSTADGALAASAASGPFYTTRWFAVVVLIAWAVIPLALGYLRFERTDL